MTTPKHSSLATIALILGGVAIGITEFVTMGLLPQIAGGVGVDIPTAGHAISAYAVGVVIGAPVLAAWGASKPRKGLLLGLVVAIIVGNVLGPKRPSAEKLSPYECGFGAFENARGRELMFPFGENFFECLAACRFIRIDLKGLFKCNDRGARVSKARKMNQPKPRENGRLFFGSGELRVLK